MVSPSVLHVVHSLNPGGAERTVIDIVSRLAPRMPTAICCLDEQGGWATEVIALGVPVTTLNRRPGFQPALGLRLAQLARRHQATVLHCHQYTPFVYGRIAALRQPELRIVFTEQGRLSDRPPTRKRKLINPLLGRLPARIYAVSEDLRRHMIASGFPPARVGVIYNAIDGGSVPAHGARAAARAILRVRDEAFLVGTAARLDPVKDLGTLIQALRHLRVHCPAAELVIIGDGSERARLDEQVRAEGLEGVVHFPGYRPDVRQLLPALDVYVNCSTSEGISLTILEAMASALPVVATRVGGNPEVVDEDVSGVLVPARAPEALAAALRTLSESPSRCATLGSAGRRRMEATFAVDAMVEKYVSAYAGGNGESPL